MQNYHVFLPLNVRERKIRDRLGLESQSPQFCLQFCFVFSGHAYLLCKGFAAHKSCCLQPASRHCTSCQDTRLDVIKETLHKPELTRETVPEAEIINPLSEPGENQRNSSQRDDPKITQQQKIQTGLQLALSSSGTLLPDSLLSRASICSEIIPAHQTRT